MNIENSLIAIQVKDVFAGLGSGLVKCTDAGVVKGSREDKPDFERQQMERSGGRGMREEKRVRGILDEEEHDGFKRPKVAFGRGRGGGGGRPRPAPGWKKNPDGYTKYR